MGEDKVVPQPRITGPTSRSGPGYLIAEVSTGRVVRSALIVFVLALAGCGKSELDPRLALCISSTKQVATSPGFGEDGSL